MILLVCSTARRSSLFLAGCRAAAAALNPPKRKTIGELSLPPHPPQQMKFNLFSR